MEGGIFGLGGVADKSVTLAWYFQGISCSLSPVLASAAQVLPSSIPKRNEVIADLFPFKENLNITGLALRVSVGSHKQKRIESKVGTGFLGIFPDHLAGLLFLVTCRHVLPDEASCDNAICTFEASGQPGHSLTQAWRRGPPRSLSEDIMGAGASTEAAEAFNKASIADITAALAALSTEELAKIKEASAGAASASEQKEAGAEAAKPEEPAQDATKPAESATEEGSKPVEPAAAEEGSKPVEPAAAEEGSKPVEPAAAEAPPKEALEDAELKLKFQAAFRAIDTNKSGFIEVNELEAVLQTLGVNLTSEQAHTSVPFQESMIQPSYLSKSTVEL
ncbi:RMD1 [Symbiodinium sp. CCMP2592]|nr:RMD1 [Symbiodinium sp. CCMP2592]